MKKISVLIPCYNEEENVVPMSEAVADIFAKELPEYDYELVFIDNDSKDATRPLLRDICKKNPHVKAIFNAKKLWTVQFAILWNLTDDRRLYDFHVL